MIRRFGICLATVALSIGGAASRYTVEIPHPLLVGDSHLKAGEYEVQVRGTEAIFRSAQSSIRVRVQVQKDAGTIRYTILETINNRLSVIHVGGTDRKLVFPALETTTNVGE